MFGRASPMSRGTNKSNNIKSKTSFLSRTSKRSKTSRRSKASKNSGNSIQSRRRASKVMIDNLNTIEGEDNLDVQNTVIKESHDGSEANESDPDGSFERQSYKGHKKHRKKNAATGRHKNKNKNKAIFKNVCA